MYLGESVVLQGSATDPDGDPIFAWEWQVVSAPTGSACDLTHADTANARFMTDMIGDYTLTLIASDGLLWSDPDATVVIVVENHSPTAIIEATPISGPAPLVVSFDGTNSFDPEGEELLYDWNFGDLTFGTGAQVSHEYTNPGIYTVKLFVEDEFGNADFDTIEITVTEGGNHPPVADAGENQTMYLGETVVLQGSATDPDGDPIFDWEWQVVSAPAGSNWSLADAGTPNAIFNTNMTGNYVVTLRASDGLLWSDPDATVVIVVENQKPTAIIEATPISGPAPLVVSFDGTESFDPEGEALAYNWYFGDLSTGAGAEVSHEYTTPGIYTVELIITDEFGNDDFDSIEITVTPGTNIQVSPEAYDFGDVELGTSSSTIITITNTGGTGDPLELSDISFAEGSSGDFAITYYPATLTVSPGESVDVGVTFTPSAEGYVSAVLQISSNDGDGINPLIEVALGGVGVYVELPPEGQIAAILAFIKASVEAGTLFGDGPGNSAGNRLNAFINMIEATGDLIEDGLYAEACDQLGAALKKCDGQPSPPDFVAGEAVEVLKGMIEVLRTTLGCE